MTVEKLKTVCPINGRQWREWLLEHHATEKSVWLIYHKKKSTVPSINWSQAVDEALCFGWIDSVAKSMDGERYRQFFSPRKPTSGWSGINKEKVGRLIAEGRMAPAGFVTIDTAKRNGSWTILDDAEVGIIPADLERELRERSTARNYVSRLSLSDKRTILQWLALAKRPETRQKRITEIVDSADQNQKPNAMLWTRKPA